MSKKNIRNFISEEELKFEIYALKFTNNIKDINTLKSSEIKEKWDYNNNKKINRMKKDAAKPRFNNKIAQKAIKNNIKYLENLEAPLNKDDINNKFLEKRENYIEFLEGQIKTEDNTAVIKKLQDKLDRVKKLTLENYTKERFGEMLLLIIKNLRTMPSFSGYSDNWSQDFYSNSIEKTLLYIDNFDENLYSKRTGKHIKAFAYITQICFNAFINIINIRKKEEDFIKDEIIKESNDYEGVRNLYKNNTQIKDFKEQHSYKIKISEEDFKDINKIIKETIEYLDNENKIIKNNKNIRDEIAYLDKITKDKNEEYYLYIKDLEEGIKETKEKDIVKSILFITPKGSDLSKVSYENDSGFNITIGVTDISKKNKKEYKKSINGYDFKSGLSKKEQDLIKNKEELLLKTKEFEEEW